MMRKIRITLVVGNISATIAALPITLRPHVRVEHPPSSEKESGK